MMMTTLYADDFASDDASVECYTRNQRNCATLDTTLIRQINTFLLAFVFQHTWSQIQTSRLTRSATFLTPKQSPVGPSNSISEDIHKKKRKKKHRDLLTRLKSSDLTNCHSRTTARVAR